MAPISALRLTRKRKSHYSQWGEDGVLEYVLGKLPATDSYLVEFGAWDGKHLSNGFHFIEKLGYTGVLIEMESDRFLELEQNMAPFKTICVQAMVGFAGENRLDNLLAKTDLPKNFDLLSIDIDSNDYQVWEALVEFRPKVVIIEINASVKPGVIQINDPEKSFELFKSGSSISALSNLAASKGYKLILHIGCNAIFVDEKYYKIFHKKALSEYDFFTYEAFSPQQLSAGEKIQALMYRLSMPGLLNRILLLLKRIKNR